MASAGLELSGLAFLCFADGDQGFQGILVTNHGLQYTILGKVGSPPEGPHHECCMEDNSAFYDITIIDNTKVSLTQPATIQHVLRKGGDNCSLESDFLEFRTDQLIADKKAEEYIQKYFSTNVDADSYVCIGNMTVHLSSEQGNS